jgi:hypothetical protein
MRCCSAWTPEGILDVGDHGSHRALDFATLGDLFSRASARRESGAPTLTDRMALVLTADDVVVFEMHRRKMYVRKPLFSFPYVDVMHVSAERQATYVLGIVELIKGRELRLAAKRRGADAESVFDHLRIRAKVARANSMVLD